MEYGEKRGTFHTVITNDDLEKTYAALRNFILPQIQALKGPQDAS